ncbi:MAG: hypothetical protein ACOX1Z_04650 [Candidatus Ratteibacteria bacterium]
MKTKVKCIAVLLLSAVFTSLAIAGPSYKFSPEIPLMYSFNIAGDITYKYEDIPNEKFSIFSKGIITFETIEVKDDRYIIKVTPSKTVVKLNNNAFEDLSDNENAVSQVISTSVIEIKPDGEIVSIKEIAPGILDIAQIFMLLPVFPEKIAKPWKQKIPAFNIPGVPMSPLIFVYNYSQAEKETAIQLSSNQIIKEENKEKDITTVFTGKNTSKGKFVFDENKGEINSFNGIVDLVLNIVFKMPSSSDQKETENHSIPLNVGIKLNISMERQN